MIKSIRNGLTPRSVGAASRREDRNTRYRGKQAKQLRVVTGI